MKKSTLSHLIGKSQHYVNIISKSRLFVDIFAMSSVREHFERVDKVIREKEREIPGFRQTCAGWTDRHTL